MCAEPTNKRSGFDREKKVIIESIATVHCVRACVYIHIRNHRWINTCTQTHVYLHIHIYVQKTRAHNLLFKFEYKTQIELKELS